MKRKQDVIVLNAMFIAIVAVLFYVPYNVLEIGGDEGGGWYTSIGYFVGPLLVYNLRLRDPGYYAECLNPRRHRKQLRWLWLLPVAFGTLVGLLEGWSEAWSGVVLGSAMLIGVLIFNTVERNYIRKIVRQ